MSVLSSIIYFSVLNTLVRKFTKSSLRKCTQVNITKRRDNELNNSLFMNLYNVTRFSREILLDNFTKKNEAHGPPRVCRDVTTKSFADWLLVTLHYITSLSSFFLQNLFTHWLYDDAASSASLANTWKVNIAPWRLI